MKKVWLIISMVASVTLFGAGCTQEPTVAPTALKDAQFFSQQSGSGIPSNLPLYQIPNPADTSTPLGATPPTVTTDKVGAVAARPVNPVVEAKEYTKTFLFFKQLGTYFQFVNCHGTPGTLSIKHGARIMLDNRDNAAHTFGFNNKLYPVGAFDYVIVTAPIQPFRYTVTCDGGGAAQVYVQS